MYIMVGRELIKIIVAGICWDCLREFGRQITPFLPNLPGLPELIPPIDPTPPRPGSPVGGDVYPDYADPWRGAGATPTRDRKAHV